MRAWPRNVRARLTLWYTAVLACVLTVFIAATAAFLFYNLRSELDRRLREDVETVEGLLSFAPDGVLHLGSIPRDEAEEESASQSQELIEVRTLDGGVLYRNAILGQGLHPGEGVDGYSERSGLLPNGTRIRLVSRRHRVGGRAVLVRVAHTEEPLWREFTRMLGIMLLGFPLAIAVAAAGGYGLARRALRPLDEMAERAERINAECLHQRLPVENAGDELGHLAGVFNRTLARLENSFEQLRRFTADASHELRTPLTAIRSVGEVGLQKGGSDGYYRDIIGSMLEEAGRLTHLVDSLLVISRADAGQIPLRFARVPLLSAAREAAALLEVLADEKHQRLTVEGDEGATVHADPLILRQALVNLLDNAIKYSPEDGSVAVTVRTAGDTAEMEVADSGPGIQERHREKVFERFYRIDEGRSRAEGGAGLGLAIVRWAVLVNRGSISLESGGKGGSIFRIRLPLCPIGEGK